MDEFWWLTEISLPRRGLPDLTHIGDRKVRLFGCACARAVWHLLEDPGSRAAAEAMERFAEGQTSEAEWREAWAVARPPHPNRVPRTHAADPAGRAAAEAAWRAAVVVWSLPHKDGMPWSHWAMQEARGTAVAHWAGTRAAAYRAGMQPDPAGWEAARAMVRRLAGCVFGSPSRSLAVDPAWLAWKGGTVLRMAEVMYAQRRWDDLPVLADALEESGCADGTLLGHLRGSEPHALGCHAMDALLGKG
jgi:hypothetical protein